MLKLVTPSLGGDPEFFIYDKTKTGLKIIPADKILPPKADKMYTGSGEAFFDGVQAEINPNFSNCREILASYTRSCLSRIYDTAKEKGKYTKIIFAPLASIDIDLKDIEGCDMECFRFGCSPDSNIYTSESSSYPDGKVFKTRFSGGHIHLGLNSISDIKKYKDTEKLINLIKTLDVMLGISTTAISYGEEEKIRRKYYGKAGTYRIQQHGLEYRTLSSSWLTSPQLMSLVYSIARDAFMLSYGDEENELLERISDKEIKDIINSVDHYRARKVFKDTILPIYSKFPSRVSSPLKCDYVQEVMDVMMEKGFQHLFNPYSTTKYWKIPTGYFDQTYGIRTLAKDLSLNRYSYEDIRNGKGE